MKINKYGHRHSVGGLFLLTAGGIFRVLPSVSAVPSREQCQVLMSWLCFQEYSHDVTHNHGIEGIARHISQ